MSIEEQVEILPGLTTELAPDPRFFYRSQTSNPIDPRSNREDLGDDAMKASTYGLNNLETITENLSSWIQEDGEDFSDLEEIYGQILVQWGRYMGHVVPYVGGVYENHKKIDQAGVAYERVEASRETREG